MIGIGLNLTSIAILGGAATPAGPFSPLDLFGSGELGFIYDFTDTANLRQLSDGTTAVAGDGDPVGYVADLSGNGKHLIQATSTARPVFKVATPNYVLSDGVDDRLGVVDVLGGSTLSNFTIIVGYRSGGSTTGQRAYGFGATSVDGVSSGSVHWNPAPDPSMRFDGSAISGGYALAKPSTEFVRTSQKSGTAYTEWFDTTLVKGPTTNASATAIVDDFYLFYLNTAIVGRMFAIVGINRVLTSQELANAQTWVGAKAGLTI